jgi:uncharacterized protein with HEPN domain
VREDRLRLLDILEAIDRIEQYASQGQADFDHQELVQVWMIHHLQIIGEAAASLSNSFCLQYPEIPWAQIVAMRNILVHEYFGVDLNEIWRAVVQDLPVLKLQVQSVLAQLGED